MNDTKPDCYDPVHRLITLFHTAYKISGRFKLMFHPEPVGSDASGNVVISIFLMPLDALASQCILPHVGNFLVLQVLENMIPAELLGYDFELRVLRAPVIPVGQLNISVLSVHPRNQHLARAFYHAHVNSQFHTHRENLGEPLSLAQ